MMLDPSVGEVVHSDRLWFNNKVLLVRNVLIRAYGANSVIVASENEYGCDTLGCSLHAPDDLTLYGLDEY